MKLSLSVRIAEAACKTKLNVPFGDLVQLAKELGYRAICMRASAGGIGTPRDRLEQMRSEVEAAGIVVSMVTADSDVPLNNERGPDSLRDIDPSLDVAEALGCDLIRVCLKQESDIEHARRAADRAGERGIRLAHQCHTTTLFEQVDASLAVLEEIGRPNFGLIYEPANLMLCGEPYDETTLKQFLPYLMNVYVQNHRLDENGPEALETWCLGERRFHHIPIWERGGVDFDSVIAGLKAVGYEGYFTVHQAYAHLMGPEEAAVKSAEYLRSFGCFE
ncbi:MAG: sugar phosphate isomerase/epimerase [Planctomycetota bacterium]|nr:MAG: sugar phosphate isomerase/epimerase [Planctomycetota bacterium]REK21402.1 MAG: sugar phosphate isomerase/epimerase [Planctomycetota bacterium]REK40087.1 MAG: sugar phosphate isomerase/epimerase [Planctomycetota bacterium]